MLPCSDPHGQSTALALALLPLLREDGDSAQGNLQAEPGDRGQGMAWSQSPAGMQGGKETSLGRKGTIFGEIKNQL